MILRNALIRQLSIVGGEQVWRLLIWMPIHIAGYFAVRLGVFAMIWATVWTLNIAKYNTIIYYPIIELFKQ